MATKMKLHDLPVEILRETLNGKNSWAAIELWKTGNTILRHKLANRGITVVDLEDISFKSRSGWPQCLSEFKLTSVRVSCPEGGLEKPFELRNRINKLQSGLKSLEICAKSLDRTFFARFRSDGWTRPFEDHYHIERPSKHPKTQEDLVGDILHDGRWNMDVTWPHLERLELSSISLFDDFCSVNPSLFGLLPRSLLWFTCCLPFRCKTLNDLSALPPRLQTLRLADGCVTEAGLRTLPKSLTDIRHCLDRDSTCALIREPGILPLLENLGLSRRALENIHDPIFVGEGYAFPPMRKLTFIHLDTLYDKLPKNLVSLHLHGSPTIALPSQRISMLPRCLTTMKLGCLDWGSMDASATKSWPSTLTYIKCDYEMRFGPHCFRLLPRSLKTFTIGSRGHQRHDPDGNLQDDLQALCNDLYAMLAIGKESLRLEADIWTKEEARLVSGGAEAYAEKIEFGHLFGLPLGLTKLKIYEMDYTTDFSFSLPPKLTSVAWIPTALALDDARLIGGFSPLTASLHFDFLAALPQSHDLSQSVLHAAPITSLIIGFSSPQFEGFGLQHLPTSLRHLSFKGINVVNLEELSSLPPRLESFLFHGTFASEGFVAELPKTLTSLTLSAPILGSDIADLPQSLTYLRSSFKNASLDHLLELPRSLRKLHAVAVDGKVDDDGAFLPRSAIKALITAFRPFWRIWEADKHYIERLLAEHKRKRRAARQLLADAGLFEDI